MKSFSSTSFAGEQEDVHAHIIAAVKKNPQALFTDFQWFLYRARNTVYFTAYSEDSFDLENLIKFVGNVVALAPQLTHGFVGAIPGQPLPRHTLEAVTSVEEVDNFDGYPDKWLEPGQEVFDEKELPLFRVRAIVRRGGPDKEGRASMIIVRSSHALMEGSDSALLSRSQNSSHGTMSSKTNKVPFGDRVKFALTAAISSPIHLIVAHLKSPKKQEMGFRSIAFERDQLRRVASKVGVSQRALMFGLTMFALNKGSGLSQKEIKTIYTTLDTERVDADDDFFRVRSVNANFDVHADLLEFLRQVEARIKKVESEDTTNMQLVMNATFKAHRLLSRFLPFLYGSRFFRYNGDYNIVLTLVPPHRMYGNLTAGMMEPVYCGSYHPGSNLCTFVPGRKKVTFNFSIYKQHLASAEGVVELLDQLDAS